VKTRRFGILLADLSHMALSHWHRRVPLAPLLFALGPVARPAARWGPSFWWGAAISAAISRILDAERSLPHIDGYALARCQFVLLSFHRR